MGAGHSSPYEGNAFRILGIGVRATSREIRRRAGQLRLELELGGANLEELQRIREAVVALDDPVQRLVEELYWVQLAPDLVPADLDPSMSKRCPLQFHCLFPLWQMAPIKRLTT